MNNKLSIQICLQLLLLTTTVYYGDCSLCSKDKTYKNIENYMINPSKSIKNGAVRKFSGTVSNAKECRQKCCSEINCNIAVYRPSEEFITETNCVTYYCPSKKCILARADDVTIYAFTKSNKIQQNNQNLPGDMNRVNLQHKMKPSNKGNELSTSADHKSHEDFQHKQSNTVADHKDIRPQIQNQIDPSHIIANNGLPSKKKKPQWQSNGSSNRFPNDHKLPTKTEPSQAHDWKDHQQNMNTGKDHWKDNNGNTSPLRPDNHKPNHHKWPLDEAHSNHDPLNGLPFQHSQNSNQDLPGWQNSPSHTNGHDENINLHHGQLDFDHKFHKKPKLPHQQILDHDNNHNKPSNKGESQPLGHSIPHKDINNHKPPSHGENDKQTHHIHNWPSKHFHVKPTPQHPFRNHQNHPGNKQISSSHKPIINNGQLSPTKNHQNQQVLHHPHTGTHNHKWPDHNHIRPTDRKELPKHHQWNHKPTQNPDEKVVHHGSSVHESNHDHQQSNNDFGKVEHHQSHTVMSLRTTTASKQLNHINGNTINSKAKPTKNHQMKITKSPPTTFVHNVKTATSSIIAGGDKNNSVSNTKSNNQKDDGFTLVLHEDHHDDGLSNNERAEFTNLIIALGVALGIVIILLIAVLLRLKRIHSRLRMPNAKDEDVLINGIYF